MTDNDIIDAILRREGGYVNDPADAGGPTKFGITRLALEEHRGRPAMTQDVADLTEAEARAIYMDSFIVRPGFHRIDGPELRAAVVDAGVNHGPRAATQMLQRAVGTKEDGVLGEKTLAGITDLGQHGTMARFAAERVRFYGRLISSKPDQAKFAAGWLNRAAEFIEALA